MDPRLLLDADAWVAVAGGVGALIVAAVSPSTLRYALAASFIAMAGWILVPDRIDEDDSLKSSRFGVLGTTIVAFFLAEMGDKTQIATVMLAAKYHSLVTVTTGTTLGMMIANVPVVYLGKSFSHRIPFHIVRRVTAALFAVLGVVALTGVGG